MVDLDPWAPEEKLPEEQRGEEEALKHFVDGEDDANEEEEEEEDPVW